MKNKDYKQPQFAEKNFNCPHCNVLAYQNWKKCHHHYYDRKSYYYEVENLLFSSCQNCEQISIWYKQKMIYPKIVTAPLPNEDMPESVKEIYEEARDISKDSPRAAAALLRVALEKLTEHLGEKKGNLNRRIGNLKKRGLDEAVIKSLDIVRITSNEGGSHAGQIDLTGKDNEEIVDRLFWLVNYIIEKTITEPKEIESQFNQLPKEKKDGIQNRDSKT